MKQKREYRKIQRNFTVNEEELRLLKLAAETLNTYEAELIREALKEFYENRGIK